MKDHFVRLMLDSGAYTAWKKGTPLDVHSYAEWCLERRDLFHTIVNLDVIPGSAGRKPSLDEVDLAAKESSKNHRIMTKAGLQVMPVFHYGERRYWLEKMLDSGAPYIGIGGLVSVNTEQRIRWLDTVFGILCGSKGFTETRVHGFGITALPVMFRYPWYSVDSTSWVRWGAYGLLFIPRPGSDGKPCWDENYIRIFLTDHPLNTAADRERFENLGQAGMDYVSAYYKSLGYEIDDLRKDHYRRKKANAHFFHLLGKNLPPAAFHRAREIRGLLDNDHEERGRETPINPRVKVFLVFSPADEQSRMLTEVKHRERLVSYLYLNNSNYDLQSLVTTGIPEKQPRTPKRVRLQMRSRR